MIIWNIVCWVLIAITSYIGWCFICSVIIVTITDYIKRKKKKGSLTEDTDTEEEGEL